MMKKPRGLGSGLGALLPDAPASGVREIAISEIHQNPRQPRTYFDEDMLEDLVASIREHGIIQPLIVSERERGYELVAGERRWRAAQRAGLTQVPVIVRETTPQQLLELALIENIQRADLNPMEEARAFDELVREFGLTDSEVAQRVGKNNRVTVANTRRLLKLSPQAQEAILKNTITAGHGRALLRFEDADQQQVALAALIDDALSVREAEELGELAQTNGGDVARAIDTLRRKRASRVGGGRGKQRAEVATPSPAEEAPTTTSADDRALGDELGKLLHTPVAITRTSKELRVTISFYDEEKIQEFLDLLAGAQP